MTIITIETNNGYSIRTLSYDVTLINWTNIMKIMNEDTHYSIRVLEIK